MIRVAKVLIRNHEGAYLMLYRNKHPIFGNALDTPGGTLEKNESLEAAAIRETFEETGIALDESMLIHLVTTKDYSYSRNEYTLYLAVLKESCDVRLSWEHADYEWMAPEAIIKASIGSRDGYLRLAGDTLIDMDARVSVSKSPL